MKYKVGDKVRVRSDLEVGKAYGGFSFLDGMAEMRGKQTTIEMIVNFSYRIKNSCFNWTDEMFESVSAPIAFSTGDMLNELAKNPGAKYKTVNSDRYDFVADISENGYIRFTKYLNGREVFISGNLKSNEKWMLVKSEPKPVSFIEAFTANRKGETIQCVLKGNVRIFKSTYTGCYSVEEIEDGIWTIEGD